MKNKKLILLTIVALSCMSTAMNAWYDDDGYHPVRNTGEDIASGTEEMAEGNLVGGAAEVVASPVTGLFGGRERREERRERRRERRDKRTARRAERRPMQEEIETEEMESEY